MGSPEKVTRLVKQASKVKEENSLHVYHHSAPSEKSVVHHFDGTKATMTDEEYEAARRKASGGFFGRLLHRPVTITVPRKRTGGERALDLMSQSLGVFNDNPVVTERLMDMGDRALDNRARAAEAARASHSLLSRLKGPAIGAGVLGAGLYGYHKLNEQ